jgi:hypothetical protein
MRRTCVLVFVATTALLLVSAAPAGAQQRDDDETLVVLTGSAEVAEGEELDTVVIFNGPATIDGTIGETVVAFNGDVRVAGTVEGDVVSLNGRVTVVEGGRVGGDVVSRRSAVIAPGATVDGEVRRFDPDAFDVWFSVVARLAWWVAVTVSLVLLGLLLAWLVPRLVDATVEATRTAAGPVIGWGLVVLLALPIAALILLATLVALPLGFLLLVAVAMVSVLGYIAAAWIVGRWLVRPPRHQVLAFLAGIAVLRVIALVPFVGGLVWFAAAVLGTGALVVSAWRARAAVTPAPAGQP